jgi:hypothetical protein
MKIEQKHSYIPSYFNNPLLTDDINHYYSKYPRDYMDFIRTKGEGIIGDFIRIYAPHRAEQIEPSWKKNIGEIINAKYIKDELFIKEVIFIGDTRAPDHIFFYDKNYYVYLYQVKVLLENVGSKLQNVLDFYHSGKYWDSIDTETFTPFDSSWFYRGLDYMSLFN